MVHSKQGETPYVVKFSYFIQKWQKQEVSLWLSVNTRELLALRELSESPFSHLEDVCSCLLTESTIRFHSLTSKSFSINYSIIIREVIYERWGLLIGLNYSDEVLEKYTSDNSDSRVIVSSNRDHHDVYSCLLQKNHCVQVAPLSGKYETPQKSAVRGGGLDSHSSLIVESSGTI